MLNLEEADVMGEFSALKPFGHDYFFRIVDVLKAGKILETEVEVLRLRSANSPDAPFTLDQSPIIGKAVISTSFSKHWEATIELMQANTNDRFLNMQIFAGLLRARERETFSKRTDARGIHSQGPNAQPKTVAKVGWEAGSTKERSLEAWDQDFIVEKALV
ncbi:hypothetical protein HO133_005735 [Letharia lupina]|uniref:Uncharacterized protein n=1 Tax=Letharia lupina TaxID=560253 RepID=A0A8H6F891_9LECA|nr:uncharacterized protein HO133_005735 [Letharia lupina]KAF6218388.1 hypothetical protein HO133_005735 [Letharia lupina]